MWFFDWFETYFGYAKTYVNSAADAIESIPLLGSYVAYPFRWVSWAFANLETAAGDASSWSDGVYNSVDQFWATIIAKAESKWSILTKSAYDRFLDFKSYIRNEWSILAETKDTIWTYVSGKALAAWSILGETKSSIWSYVYSQALAAWSILGETKDTIWTYVYGKSVATWSILAETKPTLWTWFENNKLGAWFDAQILKAKTTILGFVTAEIGFLTTQWFSFLNTSWSSVKGSFAWLIGKLLEIIDAEIDTYKEQMWKIFEKLLDKIKL